MCSTKAQKKGEMEMKRLLMVVILMAATFTGFAQSREQRLKANEFKCSFDGRYQTAKGGDKHTADYGILGYSKSKSRGIDCFYTLRLNSKAKETFTIETIFMAKQDKRTFPFAKDEVEVTLTKGFTTNVVVTSPELTKVKRKIMSGSGQITCCTSAYTYSYSEEGSSVAGAIGRLKKDGIIIKTWCSLRSSDWTKLAWQPTIELTEPKDRSLDTAPFWGVPPPPVVNAPAPPAPVRKR